MTLEGFLQEIKKRAEAGIKSGNFTTEAGSRSVIRSLDAYEKGDELAFAAFLEWQAGFWGEQVPDLMPTLKKLREKFGMESICQAMQKIVVDLNMDFTALEETGFPCM